MNCWTKATWAGTYGIFSGVGLQPARWRGFFYVLRARLFRKKRKEVKEYGSDSCLGRERERFIMIIGLAFP